MNCANCDKRIKKNVKPEAVSSEVYDTPWDEEPRRVHFCCEECEESYMHPGDFNYFWCDDCNRLICEQNPRNGWHVQYRWAGGGMICLRCYQELILEEGVDPEKLRAGEIPGMFFSYGNTEAKEAGYVEDPEYTNYFVRGSISVQDFIKRSLELIDQGKKVVIGYENIGIGGGEGYVTLMYKNGRI